VEEIELVTIWFSDDFHTVASHVHKDSFGSKGQGFISRLCCYSSVKLINAFSGLQLPYKAAMQLGVLCCSFAVIFASALNFAVLRYTKV